MKWFRWWHGTTTDAKFGGIAAKVGQTRERVVFVWASLCESASENEADRGTYTCDPSDIAATLWCDLSHIETIIGAFESRAMLDGKRISAWDERNPARDDAAQRQRIKRDKDTAVTPTARDKRVTVTPVASDERKPDTDSDTESKNPPAPSEPPPRKRGVTLGPSWSPSPADLSYAQSRGFSVAEAQDLAANFREYWTNGKGRTSTKLDWTQAWQTWVRKEKPHAPNRIVAARPDRPRTIAEARARKDRAELEAMAGPDRDVGDGIAAAWTDGGAISGAGGGLREVAGGEVRRLTQIPGGPEISGSVWRDGAVEGIPDADADLRSDGSGAGAQEGPLARIVGVEGRQARPDLIDTEFTAEESFLDRRRIRSQG